MIICSEAKNWLESYANPKEAWYNCRRTDWMLYYIYKQDVDAGKLCNLITEIGKRVQPDRELSLIRHSIRIIKSRMDYTFHWLSGCNYTDLIREHFDWEGEWNRWRREWDRQNTSILCFQI